MIGTFVRAFAVPEVRGRIIWLFAGFAIFAISVHIPIPGVDRDAWSIALQKGALFQLVGMFTGGALAKFSIAAMGITPYINASIIMQLLTVVFPYLKELQKEGEISEDDLRRAEQDIQKVTDEHVARVDAKLTAKEEEMMAV